MASAAAGGARFAPACFVKSDGAREVEPAGRAEQIEPSGGSPALEEGDQAA